MSLRVGLDIVAVDAVAAALRAPHREHYLDRVYTAAEVDSCRGPSGRVEPERLAARFAAKEAAIKALPGAGEEVRLTAIEVVSEADGQVRLELSGKAAELARDAGVEEIALSISHDAGIAAATVVMA